MFGLLKRRGTPSPPPGPERWDMLLAGLCVPVEYARDRHTTLRISVRREGYVRVRGPQDSTRAQAEDFLRRKAGWIAAHLQRFREMEAAAPAPGYRDGETLLFLGRAYRLALRRGGKNAVELLEAEGLLLVTTRAEPAPEQVRKLVEAWRRARAWEIFPRVLKDWLPRVQALGPARPAQLKLRSMKSRWGSCSRLGVITLNLALAQAPPECIEYVVAHELCHLLRMAHDERFKALLTAVMPDWRRRRALLRGLPIL